MNQSRSEFVPQSNFPAGLGGKNGWFVPNWIRRSQAFLTDSDAELFMYLVQYIRFMKSSASEPAFAYHWNVQNSCWKKCMRDFYGFKKGINRSICQCKLVCWVDYTALVHTNDDKTRDHWMKNVICLCYLFAVTITPELWPNEFKESSLSDDSVKHIPNRKRE